MLEKGKILRGFIVLLWIFFMLDNEGAIQYPFDLYTGNMPQMVEYWKQISDGKGCSLETAESLAELYFTYLSWGYGGCIVGHSFVGYGLGDESLLIISLFLEWMDHGRFPEYHIVLIILYMGLMVLIRVLYVRYANEGNVRIGRNKKGGKSICTECNL